MRDQRIKASALVLAVIVWSSVLTATPVAAQAPEGEMRWALYVTISPSWFDPGEAGVAGLNSFWIGYALHDALVKPMPGNPRAPSLAESWTLSADRRIYDFKLREGVKFHNGDPFTAEDVKFTFLRYRSKIFSEKVREVEIVDRHRVRFHLHQPWPDFMAYYGTLASGAGWIVPKNYIAQVGDEGFRKHPIGLGPYKFVSYKPGVELVLEAFESYWRKVPHVKRLVLKTVPDATTRMAMLRRGEVDIAYDLDAPNALDVKRDPRFKLAFSGGIGVTYLDFLHGQWDAKSPWSDQRVRLAASLAIDRRSISEAETLGASIPTANIAPREFDFVLPLETHPYEPIRAKQLLAQAGYPNGFDGGDLIPTPPYFDRGEMVAGYLGAIGIKLKVRTMERAPFLAARAAKQLRGLCICGTARYGNAAVRIEETVVTGGTYAYGGYPDLDELFRQQDAETDGSKREALLHRIQRMMHERVVVAPLFLYVWPSGIGPRVQESGLMLINPYPWSAPYEDVRLKKP
jgi:peptide/nickel transport system substrate-binding protein